MTKVLLTLMVAVMLLVSCATVEVPKIVSVDTEENEVFSSRGVDYQVIEDDSIEMAMQGTRVTTKTAAITVDVRNKTEERVNLYDTDFEIFRGNMDENRWTSYDIWDAEAYYLDAKKKYDTAGVLRVLETIGDIFFFFSSSSRDSETRATGALLESGTDIASGIATVSAINATNGKSPKWLSENLLYPATIRARDSYQGVMMFPMGKKKDNIDMKIVYKGGTDEEKSFIFQRTDRAEVLNPWLDSRFRRKLTLGFGYDPFSQTMSFPMILSYPKGIGFYMGANFKTSNPQNAKYATYDMPYTLTNEYIDGSYAGVYAGISLKVAPYTWLLGGVDLLVTNPMRVVEVPGSSSSQIYYRYDRSGKGMFAPQIGVNCIFNFIDVFAILEYNTVLKKLRTFIGGGIAFTTI